MRLAASLLTMMAGRVFLISPPNEGSNATHHISPRRGSARSPFFIRDVPHQPLTPLPGLSLALLISRHRSVAFLQPFAYHVGTRQVVQEAADVGRPTTLHNPRKTASSTVMVSFLR